MILADSHTHLDQYPTGEILDILDRAAQAHVGPIICAGTTLASSRACVRMSNEHTLLYGGVGIHPMEVTTPLDEKMYDEIKKLATGNPKVVCISEIGLDYLPESPHQPTQHQVFQEQIKLAKELHLPIIFHSRESHSDVFRILRECGAGDVGGVMHYFQGDERTAKEIIDAGFYISLARPLLRLPELQETARAIPLENMVLETDAAPQPFKKHRHNWTEPKHVKDVAEKLAELKEATIEEVAEVTTKNLINLLGLKLTAGEPQQDSRP